MRAHILVALCVVGCGRVGYDALGDAGVEADGATGRETWTFGEAPGTTVGGVTADTLMCAGQNSEDLNWGAFERIEGGESCTGLVRFDITSLPAGATAIDASLALWPELVPSSEGQVDVHRVIEAWDEGTGTGQPGAASYLERQPGVAWSQTGARPPDSSDATVLHSFHPGVLEAQVIPIPAAVVQGWIDDPSQNHGVALFGSGYGTSDTQHPHFVSSDAAEAAQRPVFTITFE